MGIQHEAKGASDYMVNSTLVSESVEEYRLGVDVGVGFLTVGLNRKVLT